MTQQSDRKPKLAERVHPTDRGRIAALNMASQAIHGAAPQGKPPTSYYTPLLIQCTLPHSEPKVNPWIRKNGDFMLMVSTGYDKEGVAYGIPYGSFPRLTLAYIITQVIKSGKRHIELSSSFGGFLKEIGYIGNLRGSTRASKTIQSQLLRLVKSNIIFEQADGNVDQGKMISGRLDVADTVALWWDYKQPEQGSLWGSYIELSEKFHQAILDNPVPLRTDILAALKKSPLALDVYMWVSHRLFTLQAANQEQVTLGYGRLQEQFGTGISEANYRQFRRELKLALVKVAEYWRSPGGEKQLLNYELHEEGLTLFSSPLLINIPKRKIAETDAEEEAKRILAARKFDDITRKQARQAAGEKYDVRWLETQYFAWIEAKGIAPKDPRAHFLSFIKRHRKRNGEAV
jgi:hypothetical protein